MKPKLSIYIGVVTIFAIALFLYLLPSLPSFSRIWIPFLFFLIISIFAEFVPVQLPVGGAISIGFPIDFLLILVYGPALAMLISALGALLGEMLERKVSWYKIMFNTSQYALTAGISGIVYQKVGGIVGTEDDNVNFAIPEAQVYTHIFEAESRTFYGLEYLWKEADKIKWIENS